MKRCWFVLLLLSMLSCVKKPQDKVDVLLSQMTLEENADSFVAR